MDTVKQKGVVSFKFHIYSTVFPNLLQVFTLDARNHGESPHTNEISLELMSSDLICFLSVNNISRCILIGHSMGGRTAMLTALQCPTLIESLIVVDVSPVPSPGEPFNSIVYIIYTLYYALL